MLGPDLRLPRHDRSLGALLPSLLGCLGRPGYDDTLGLASHLDGVRRAIVLLVDGLGRANLAAHLDAAPTLAGLADPIGGLDTVAPSTTPTALTSLATGRTPGEHGIVGFTVAVPGTDQLLTHISWPEDGPDPAAWQPYPSVLVGSGTVSGPWAFRDSRLTRAMHRDVPYRSTVSGGDLATALLGALDEGRVAYGYDGDLDATGHVRGCAHPAWRAQLRHVDLLVEQILAGLPADAALLVTADHGMLDVPPAGKVDLDAPGTDLLDGVRVLAGEPRARYLHVVDGALADVRDRWTALEAAMVMERAEAIDLGLFGPVVTADAAARLGDLVVWARPGTAVVAGRQERAAAGLVGYHGSLSAIELEVPLLVGRS